MKEKKYVLALDEGTTGTKAFIYDKNLKIVATCYEELTLYSTSGGYAEQDGEEIFDKSVQVCKGAMEKAGIGADEIICMAIDNQRSSMSAWEKSGKAYGRVFTWQDKRLTCATSLVHEAGMFEYVREHLGRGKPSSSINDIYWKAENEPGFREKLEAGELLCGGIDTWLVYKLTGGKKYVASADNATLNGFIDYKNFAPTDPYLELLNLPKTGWPEMMENAGDYGVTEKSLFGVEIPIRCVIADQHSAVYAQRAVHKGDAKCTVGTGAFIDINAGHEPVLPDPSHSTMLGWYLDGEPTYIAECYATTAGTFQRWIKRIFELENYPLIDKLAASVPTSDGLYILPTTFGLVYPVVDNLLRAAFVGISDSTTRAHVMRATLEGLSYLMNHLVSAMVKDLGIEVKHLRVDGGLVNSDIFCDITSQVMNLELQRPDSVELTSLGAAELAGKNMGIWNESDFDTVHKLTTFKPDSQKVDFYAQEYKRWASALAHARDWAKGE